MGAAVSAITHIQNTIKPAQDIEMEEKHRKELESIMNTNKEFFDALRISEDDVKTIHQAFCLVDNTCALYVHGVDILHYIDVSRTSFTNRVLNTKKIGRVEMTHILEDVYGKKFAVNKDAQKTLQDINLKIADGGLLDVNDFRKFLQTHHKMLFPAFEMQHYMQVNVGGERFWQRLTIMRLQTFIEGKLFTKDDFDMLETNAVATFYREDLHPRSTTTGATTSGTGVQNPRLKHKQHQLITSTSTTNSASTTSIISPSASTNNNNSTGNGFTPSPNNKSNQNQNKKASASFNSKSIRSMASQSSATTTHEHALNYFSYSQIQLNSLSDLKIDYENLSVFFAFDNMAHRNYAMDLSSLFIRIRRPPSSCLSLYLLANVQ
eukprot:gene2787-5491_t